MIVGIDVYHEKGKQMSSVVGFVASMDKTFTEWYSVAAMQRSTHQELMKSVQDAFHKVVNQFKAVSVNYITITLFEIELHKINFILEKWVIT